MPDIRANNKQMGATFLQFIENS